VQDKLGDSDFGFPRKINSSLTFRLPNTSSRESWSQSSSEEVSCPRKAEASVTPLRKPKKLDYQLLKKHHVLQSYNCGNKVNHTFSENAVQVESHKEQASTAMSWSHSTRSKSVRKKRCRLCSRCYCQVLRWVAGPHMVSTLRQPDDLEPTHKTMLWYHSLLVTNKCTKFT
jgi:hypothetical protein